MIFTNKRLSQLLSKVRGRLFKCKSVQKEAEPKRKATTTDQFPLDMTNGCPDCQSDNFLEGPSGGMCVNVKCENCGHTFNIFPMLGAGHRISPTEEEIKEQPFMKW